MDLDLEIISEEGDCPDPLFNSIMNAMNSMKEATADKIYQKIQKEGQTNYSKPQVDRALASALKYGIFEIRNNRYRVRDNMLDDEDTVYWKLKNSKEESPYQSDNGLNPERDNLRFKKVNNSEREECPQCGRAKRPSKKLEDSKESHRKKEKGAKPNKRPRKIRQSKKEDPRDYSASRKVGTRRRTRLGSPSEGRQVKVRKIAGLQANTGIPVSENIHYRENLSAKSLRDQTYHGGQPRDVGKFDSTDESEIDSLSSPSDDERGFTDYQDKRKARKTDNPDYVPPCFQDSTDDKVEKVIRENVSIPSFQSESDSEKSDETFSSHKDTEPFMESLPCTSRSASTKEPSRNQFMNSNELYGKQYGREQVDSTDRKPDWMGYADQPQGKIIESNNVLLIEPMDSMGFKSQEQASYIS